MRFKHLPVVAAFALSAPAFAVTVNMTDFVFPTNPVSVVVNGGSSAPSYTGAAGEFYGTLGGTADSARAGGSTLRSAAGDAGGTSFVAWCIDLSQTFSFHTAYTDYQQSTATSLLGAARVDALSRLFTAAQGFVVDETTSALMQAAIWEIEYESGSVYDLAGGNFTVGLQTQTVEGRLAFDTIEGYLANLGSYGASFSFNVLTSGTNQDFLVPIGPIPEPETWAMLMAGLGALGWAGRRRAAQRARATA